MELTIKARHGKITENQRQHIEEKLSRLGRYLDQLTSASIEITTEQQRNAGEMHRVQVTLVGEHGVILRAEEQASELYAAVDAVLAILQRQITRYKEKSWRRGKLRRQGDRFIAPETTEPSAPAYAEDEAQERQITRTKAFTLRPMFTDDAVEQMELLGHTFFVFQDAENQRVSIIYRRRDGNYGLIVPQAV